MSETTTVWICSDCMMLLANGEVADDVEQEPMALLNDDESIEHVTPGLMADEHHEDCDFRISTHAVEADEMFGVPDGEEPNYVHDCNLQCEERGFSHARCDGCGGLPGDRYAATVWLKEVTA